MGEVFANDASAVVSAGGTDAPLAGSVQTWTLVSSTLPVISFSAGTFAYVADPAAESEKIQVTDVSGATATVVRGADGTTPVAHAAGFTVSQVVAAASLGSFLQAGIPIAQPVTGLQAVTSGVVALAYAATLNISAPAGNHFRVTLTGNATVAAPASPTDGQKLTIEVIQDASGSRTLTWNAAFDFGSSGAPTLTATGTKRDLLGFIYSSSLSKWMYAGATLGL